MAKHKTHKEKLQGGRRNTRKNKNDANPIQGGLMPVSTADQRKQAARIGQVQGGIGDIGRNAG